MVDAVVVVVGAADAKRAANGRARRAAPRNAPLVDDDDAPRLARPAPLDLELDPDRAVAGAQPKLGGRALAAAAGDARVAIAVAVPLLPLPLPLLPLPLLPLPLVPLPEPASAGAAPTSRTSEHRRQVRGRQAITTPSTPVRPPHNGTLVAQRPSR